MKEELKKLIRKDFSVSVLEREIVFSQLSYYDCLDFEIDTDGNGERVVKWIFKFINKHLSDEEKISEDEFQLIDITLLWEEIKNSAFRGYFGENKAKDKLKKISLEKELEGIPYSTWIVSLAKEFKIDPLKMLKEYTPEQIVIFQEGAVYLNNEQTKEGREKNRLLRLKRTTTKGEDDTEENLSDLDILKRRIEKNEQLKKNKDII